MRKVLFLFAALFLCLLGHAENFLVLGDSHGAMDIGWVNQLKEMRPNDRFCNLAIAGNTLGFNNNNQDTLNTLRNIESYIERGKAQLGKIDKILILLGSNDCKAVYAGKTAESISNLNALIHKIKAGFPTNQPTILLISPPPAADDSLLTDKYKGMSKKLKKLIPKMQKVAQKNDIPFLNIFQPLYSDRNTLTSDGVHYKKEGYQLMAQKINEFIDFN